MKSSLLNVRKLSCERDDKRIFSDVEFALAKGELIHILGENGKGKSTLLKVLSGVIPCTHGCYELENLQTIYLGHEFALSPELSVSQNLRFLLALTESKDIINSTSIAAALKYFDLIDKQNVKVAKLSFGQTKKLALARLYLTKRKVWLLDEPYSGLDKASIALLNNLIISHLNNEGAVLIASHQELNLAYEYIKYAI